MYVYACVSVCARSNKASSLGSGGRAHTRTHTHTHIHTWSAAPSRGTAAAVALATLSSSRKVKLPPTVEKPFLHRLHWVLEGSEDKTGWAVIANHNIGDVIAFRPVPKTRFEHLNVQLGVIVSLKLDTDNKPIKVHLMGIRTKNVKDLHAHLRKWHRLMMVGGMEIPTPSASTKRTTRLQTTGRVVAGIDFRDLIRISPISLNPDGSLTARSSDELKKKS